MADREEEVQDTSDYKLDKRGRKIKAHRIVFNKGEDDGKKGVSEQMKKSFSTFVEQHTPDLTEEQLNELVVELQEVLGKSASAGEWISDFVHSDNPKFAGKSKEKRKQMALAAYYAKQRNEEVELDEAGPGGPLGYLSPEERAKEVARRKKALKANETPASKRFVDNAMKNIKPKNEETEVQEELKGKQHKLDKNKNGKLDAHDFKLLRKEEADQLDEGLQQTLRKYVPGYAKKQIDKKMDAGKFGKTDADKDANYWRYKKVQDKLKKEESEIEEELKGKQHKLDKNKNGKLDAHDFKLLRKEEQELDEAVTVKKHNYSWGKMVTVHHGSENSYPLHPEHQEAIRKLKDGEHTSFKDETNRKVTAHREGDKVHLSGAGSNKKTTVSHSHFSESVFDWKNKPRQTDTRKTGDTTKTAHTITKTSTGTVYTKQHDDQGISKEFKRDTSPAQKRGRGRPKKSSFGEAVEFLMGLDEETFDSFMEEGFDAFMEHYEQLDEVSKATLGSYVKKAVSGMSGVAVNAHMAGGEKPGSPQIKKHLEKARKRIAGIEKATDRLTK